MIRVFEGPRHDRLRAIWETIAEYEADTIRLRWFPNDQARLRHAECLNEIWRQCQSNPVCAAVTETGTAGRIILTEHDWLPDLNYPDRWLQADLDEQPDVAMAGVCYAKRTSGTRALINYTDAPGAWFMSFDRERAPAELDFDNQVDPATEILHEMRGILYPGLDPYPKHVGAEYVHGTHLFWSLHLHDDANLRVSGYRLGEIQTKHDQAVASWIRQQPQAFQELLEKRLGLSTWASSFEYIDARSIFAESFDKLSSSVAATARELHST